jgi:hypothetical protein
MQDRPSQNVPRDTLAHMSPVVWARRRVLRFETTRARSTGLRGTWLARTSWLLSVRRRYRRGALFSSRGFLLEGSHSLIYSFVKLRSGDFLMTLFSKSLHDLPLDVLPCVSGLGGRSSHSWCRAASLLYVLDVDIRR